MKRFGGELPGSPSELNSFRNPISTQEGGILFSLQYNFSHIKQELRSSKRWQHLGRGAAITLTFISSVAGIPSAKAEPSNDGNGPSCKTEEGFKLGFKLLADQIPCEVGKPLEEEHFEPSTGNSLQKTSAGLMVWRKGDNWTAFTDGARTWINGPEGLQDRDNAVRFGWEGDGQVLAEVPATPIAPAPVPTREAIPVPTTKPQNLFEDRGTVRKQFAPSEIQNINGVEIRGKELLAGDCAKNAFKIIQSVPEYDVLVRRYIKSLETYGFDWKGRRSDLAGIAVNDILGDGANLIAPQSPDQFGIATLAAEIVYNAKLAEIALNGNMAARYSYTPVAGIAPGMDREFWKKREIAGWEARKQAWQAEIDFAGKAKLFPGLAQSIQIHVRHADEAIGSLSQN